jgi:hypothetical protein
MELKLTYNDKSIFIKVDIIEPNGIESVFTHLCDTGDARHN